MNMQAMVRQAQKLQKEMLNAKEEINKKEFTGSSAMVSVKMNGKKELLEVKIDAETLGKDDIEMLQDMFVVAVNESMQKIDKETEEKMGKYTQGMPGLF